MTVTPRGRDLNTYVMTASHQILLEETKEKNIKARCQKISAEHQGIDTYSMVEKIAQEILQIIRESLDKDSFVSQERDRQYMPNIDDLYLARLLLVLQRHFKIHPFA
jgi:NMD protein affecting ribosome stability and mRNA decay